jgi:sigma-B regulation protein RsbU (phosphoserine phosphatase)
MALGILEDAPYAEGRVKLGAGDLLLLVTDGITEATDRDGALFTDERLTEVLRACASKSPREVVDRVVEQVTAFAAGAPQQDDLTLLAIRYRG